MKLHTQVLIAMALGVAAGLLLGPYVPYTAFLGKIFLLLLKMIIVPLILASIVVGVASVGDVKRLGAVGGKTVLYYMTTTAIAVIIGLILVNIIKPGVGAGQTLTELPPEIAVRMEQNQSLPGFLDSQIDVMIQNPFAALAEMQPISIIFFAILLGAVTTTMKERAKPLIDLFTSLNEAMIIMTHWVMKLAPLGVFALVANTVAESGIGVLASLAKYCITVLVGLGVHCAVLLFVFLRTLGRARILAFLSGVRTPLSIAFSTSSSSATLPITLDSAKQNLGVSEKVSDFVLPLGATINMDGTALYESVAAVFIAQCYGIQLDIGQQVIIFLTATLAAIGAAGIPSAGMITMGIVLTAIGLPLEGAALIYGVDRFLDMVRTTINVMGDAVGTVVIARSEGERLPISL